VEGCDHGVSLRHSWGGGGCLRRGFGGGFVGFGVRGPGGEQALAHRERRCRPWTIFEVPIRPGTGVEDSGRGVFEHFAEFFGPGHTFECLKIEYRPVGHDVSEEMDRVGQGLRRRLESDHAGGNRQQLRSRREGFHSALPFSLQGGVVAKPEAAVNRLTVLSLRGLAPKGK